MTIFNFRKCIRGFQYAFRGIAVAITSQQNMWVHLIVAMVVIIAGFLFNISRLEWTVIILVIVLVIALEIVNTAIEGLVDWISPNKNSEAGKIKDLAAGAVLIAAIGAVIMGFIVFLPKIIALF